MVRWNVEGRNAAGVVVEQVDFVGVWDEADEVSDALLQWKRVVAERLALGRLDGAGWRRWGSWRARIKAHVVAGALELFRRLHHMTSCNVSAVLDSRLPQHEACHQGTHTHLIVGPLLPG